MPFSPLRWEREGYLLRSAREQDAEAYYARNFAPLNGEVARLTGSKTQFEREEVISFFLQGLHAADRYHFLICSPDGAVIGESVLNEIDDACGSANFRIAIFHPEDCGRGIGSWAAACTRDFAFGTLKLHRLSLSVFSFNPRAERVYRKIGFRREGILRGDESGGGEDADEILMAMSEEDWKGLKGAD